MIQILLRTVPLNEKLKREGSEERKREGGSGRGKGMDKGEGRRRIGQEKGGEGRETQTSEF